MAFDLKTSCPPTLGWWCSEAFEDVLGGLRLPGKQGKVWMEQYGGIEYGIKWSHPVLLQGNVLSLEEINVANS